MYQIDLKKLDNTPQGISALSTCQRDYNEESSRRSELPQTVFIRPKEKNQQEDAHLNSTKRQNEQQHINVMQETPNEKQKSNNQENNDDSISTDQNNYKNVINKYMKSLNRVLSKQDENQKNNIIVPKKQIYNYSLQEESQCSYYDSEDNSDMQKDKNCNSQNDQKVVSQVNNSYQQKIQLTKAQQLTLLLQGSSKSNDQQNQLMQNSQFQASEYAEGDEQQDENYSYYEVSINHDENKCSKPSHHIQNKQNANQTQVIMNQNQMQKSSTNQNKISKDKLASINQSLQHSFCAKSIENKSSINPKAMRNSLMNEEKLQQSSIAEKTCKICLEGESTQETGQLLSPCRCNGSMQYIHEECLKTWLVSQQVDIDSAACELCKMEYNMEIIIGKKFQPSHACQDGQISFASCICLLVLVIGMITIIFLFAFKWNVIEDSSSSSSNENKSPSNSNNQNGSKNQDDGGETSFSYQLSILIACTIILIVIFALFVMSIKEAFFVDHMETWRIYNYDKEVIKNKKKNLNQKEKAQLNQQAANNTRAGNVIVSQTMNQSMLRNQRRQMISQQSQQINSSNQQNGQLQNSFHIQNNQSNNQIQQNLSIHQQVQPQQQQNQQLNHINPEENHQQGDQNSKRQKLLDQSLINNLIHDQSQNESYLNSTVLQLKANQNLNESLTYKNQYNGIDQDQENQIINQLIGDNEEQKDDYGLKQFSFQKQVVQQDTKNTEFQKSQKGSLKILSQVTKVKSSNKNLTQSNEKYVLKQNLNIDSNVNKQSIKNNNDEEDNYASIQKQSLNQQIIGDDNNSQESGIDPSVFLNKINKILNEIPPQFQDIDGKKDTVYNVLITKPINK